MQILIFVLCTLCTFGLFQNVRCEPSNLQLISEDFRILSRITNAIHLSSPAIQTEVELQGVLSELLRIQSDRFKAIVEVDVKTAKSEIERVQTEFNSAKKAKYGLDLLKGMADAVELVGDILRMFNVLSRKINILEEAAGHSKDELVNAAGKLKSSKLFDNNNCFIPEFESFRKFSLILSGNSDNLNLPSDSELAEILKNFKTNSGKAVECLKAIDSLELKFNSLDSLNTYDSYGSVFESHTIASHFAIQIGPFQRKGDLLNLIDGIKMQLKESRNIWYQDKEDPGKVQKAITELDESMKTIERQQTEGKVPDRLNTAGFRDVNDFSKVFEDFKSPWFLKKIAKNSSTEKLTQAFKPYKKVSNSLTSLEKSWSSLTDFARETLKDQEVLLGASSLKLIKEFATESSNHMKVLDKYGSAADKCFNKTGRKFDFSRLTLFQREQNQAMVILTQLEKVVGMMSQLKSSAMEELDQKMTRTESFQNVMIEVVKDISGQVNATNYHKDMMEVNLAERRFSLPDTNFYLVLLEIAALSEELSKLKNNLEAMNSQPTISMKDILSELKVIEVAKCFKEIDNLNYKITLKALSTIATFPTKTMNKTIQYLVKVSEVQTQLYKTYNLIQKVKSSKTSKSLLVLNDSRALTENLGLSTEVLENLDSARQNLAQLSKIPKFPNSVKQVILTEGLMEWLEPKEALKEMFMRVKKEDTVAEKVRDKDLAEMTKVFEIASSIHGVAGSRDKLNSLGNTLHKSHFADGDEAETYFDQLNDMGLDLDFAKHQARLKNARVTVTTIQKYFDELFGHNSQKTITIEKHIPISWVAIICFIFGFLLLLFILVLFLYAFTEKGRTQYKNWYLFYFGKKEDFEKRWRYSLFMDTADSKNALLDAVREGNKANVLKMLKNGAYINAYNKFGNTSLHFATKSGYVDIVEVLIKYGADRTLLNYKNLLPIQMIPDNPEKVEKYDRIRKIYKKYEKRSYRIRVPQTFPVTSYHIWSDESTDAKLTNRFLDSFRAIVLDEPSSNTTHVVFRTDEQGILETDNLDDLSWVFQGTILVREQWMTDCLNDETLIKKDMDYLIEKVRYRGVTYDTVLTWTEAMAKATMPYLQGVFVSVVATNCKNLQVISNIVTNQGGCFLNIFPLKQHFNIGSRPYLHAHLGPLFLIHSGYEDVDTYRNDPDHMYTLFTEEEFMHFMLKKEINRDTRINPPSVLLREE